MTKQITARKTDRCDTTSGKRRSDDHGGKSICHRTYAKMMGGEHINDTVIGGLRNTKTPATDSTDLHSMRTRRELNKIERATGKPQREGKTSYTMNISLRIPPKREPRGDRNPSNHDRKLNMPKVRIKVN